MRYQKSFVVFGALLICGLLLGACREDEQGRMLRFEKGTYLGQSDTPITDEGRAALRRRARTQGN